MSMSYVMRLIVPIIGLFLMFAAPAGAAGVSPARQTCIHDAMASGTAALGNSAQLNTLYERYFVEETIARVAAGKDWMLYDAARKSAQRNRVRRFVIEKLAPSLTEYGGSNVKLISETGSKVRGIITQPNGNKRTVIFDFGGPCQFVNITITGFGSLISFIGKEQPRPGN
jgi:hypothetical protein